MIKDAPVLLDKTPSDPQAPAKNILSLDNSPEKIKIPEKPLFFLSLYGIDESAGAVKQAKKKEQNASHLEGGMFRLYTKLVKRIHEHTPNLQALTLDKVMETKQFRELIMGQLKQELKRLGLEQSSVFLYDRSNSAIVDLYKQALQESGISFTPIAETKPMIMKEREMGEETAVEKPKLPSFSEAYLKAQEQGKRVLFICAQGQERSVAAQRVAVERGEVNTDFLHGGYLGIEDAVIDPIRMQTQIAMGLLGRKPYADEVEKLNAEIDKRSKIQLKEWMVKKGWKNKYIRVFNDEGQYDQAKSPVVHLLLECMKDLGIEYETITVPQITLESARLGSPLSEDGQAGNWLRKVVNE